MSRKPDSLSGIKVRKEGRNKDCDLWARLVLRFFPSRIWASTSTQLLEPGDAAVRRPFSREKERCVLQGTRAGWDKHQLCALVLSSSSSVPRARKGKKKIEGMLGEAPGKKWENGGRGRWRFLCRWRWGWMRFVEAFRCRVLEIIVAAVRTAQGVDGWWTGCLRSVAKM